MYGSPTVRKGDHLDPAPKCESHSHTKTLRDPFPPLCQHSFWCWIHPSSELPGFVADSVTLVCSNYGSETTVIEDLKTSEFLCPNRSTLTAIQQSSSDCSLIHTFLEIRGYGILPS
ncbi:hypothetical protein CSKR_112364 [Clonorchis sinensis]|uniref:Uncharacterized protein n=1 Tax=Clonorchis sinensis TaxID=79923 RepID=A0A419Q3W5_CLOSI|nr:hypothetical protein CSKR_112364 [Clonorchis sinensis]